MGCSGSTSPFCEQNGKDANISELAAAAARGMTVEKRRQPANKTLLRESPLKCMDSTVSDSDTSTNVPEDEEHKELANVTAPELSHDVYKLCQYILREDSQHTQNAGFRRIANKLRRQGFKVAPCSGISFTKMQAILSNPEVWSQLEHHVMLEDGRVQEVHYGEWEKWDEMQNCLDKQAKEHRQVKVRCDFGEGAVLLDPSTKRPSTHSTKRPSKVSQNVTRLSATFWDEACMS